ncbi:MAG TPA: ABC-type transport auxiliary lipoprotein family protein [Opitutaceae bacterium]|jgi:hypothetical protein|nr:ABC-type transport auxiliary lipoprotein family protein [Opitutaceae bacterium]
MKTFRLSPVILGLGLLVLAGCDIIPPAQTDPTRYYVLSDAAPAPSEAAVTSGLRIGLRSVELAGYLKSPDLIVRRGPNELSLQDYARWAEPLDAGIGRLVRDQLRADAAVSRVYLQPFPLDANRDYDVSISVARCEGGAGAAHFAATVEISTAGDSPHLVARRTFAAPDAAWDGRDFGQLAGLLSADIQALGKDIVAALPSSRPAAPSTP